MIDLTQLTAFLAPFLGFLLPAAKSFADASLDQAGRHAAQHAEALWERLWPKVSGRAAAEEAANDVALKPNDSRALASLELQLEKILLENPDIAREIEELWSKASEAGVGPVRGDRNVLTSGSIQGSVIVTGDHVAIRRQ